MLNLNFVHFVTKESSVVDQYLVMWVQWIQLWKEWFLILLIDNLHICVANMILLKLYSWKARILMHQSDSPNLLPKDYHFFYHASRTPLQEQELLYSKSNQRSLQEIYWFFEWRFLQGKNWDVSAKNKICIETEKWGRVIMNYFFSS